MTPYQLALAAGAPEKWVQNAEQVLGRRFPRTTEGARWLGLVHLMHSKLDLPLSGATAIAARAVRVSPDARDARVASAPDGETGITIDLARYHSRFVAALTAARAFGGPKQRGRRAAKAVDAIVAARDYGVDVGLLRSRLCLTPDERLRRLETDAALVSELRAAMRKRGGGH